MRQQIGMHGMLTESTENHVFRTPGLNADLRQQDNVATVTDCCPSHTDTRNIVRRDPKLHLQYLTSSPLSHLEKYLALGIYFSFTMATRAANKRVCSSLLPRPCSSLQTATDSSSAHP